MAEYDDIDTDEFSDDDTDYGYGDQGSGLVKKLRRELSATKKALKDRDTQLTSLKGETRSRTVKEFLSSRGANPKIAAFIPSDIDPTEEAIGSWLNEYGDVFGFQQESQPTSSADTGAITRMNMAEERGVSAEINDELAYKIANASSREELQEILRNS